MKPSTSLFEPNPIVARELRSYWRRRWSFGLLLGYTALMAFVMTLQYSSSLDSMTSHLESSQRMAFVGHELFSALAFAELLGLLVLAPAMTAATIAGERERGLLESLQISPLRPLQIAIGHLLSALAVLGLITLVTLPVNGVCFLLGGVSPAEFRQVTILQTFTTVTAAAVGIAVSARSRRANTSLRVSFGYVIAWIVSSYIAHFFGFAPYPSGFIAKLAWDALICWGFSNPFITCTYLMDPGSGRFGMMSSLPTLTSWMLNNELLYCLGFEIAAIAIVLFIAARAVRKPFDEENWMELKLTAPDDQTKGGASHGATGHFDVPITGDIRIGNPIFQRELRGKFRMRTPPKIVLFIEGALGLGVFALYDYILFLAWTDYSSREMIWWGVMGTAFLVMVLATAIMGASGFTRERETGTWEGLRLSMLSPSEIVSGKLGAIGLTCAIFTVPLLPLILPCIRTIHHEPTNNGVSLYEAAGTLLVFVTTALCYASWGLLISWLSKRTTGSVGWTLATIALASIVAGALESFFWPDPLGEVANSVSRPLLELTAALEPIGALLMLIDKAEHGGYLTFAAIYVVANGSILAAVRFLLLRFMVARPDGHTAER